MTYFGSIWKYTDKLEKLNNVMQTETRKPAEIAHPVSSLTCCLFETFRWDLKWDVLFETFWPVETFWNLLKLPKVSNKPEISQSLILGHVTTVSTNQNIRNSQIMWDFMRLSRKYFHLKSNAVYNSSTKISIDYSLKFPMVMWFILWSLFLHIRQNHPIDSRTHNITVNIFNNIGFISLSCLS